jgi:hypothetical protein
MVKVIIVPSVKPTLLPCFIFHVRRGELAAEENGGFSESECTMSSLETMGHYVEIKRNRL